MKTVAMLRETAFDAIGGLVKLARAGDDVAARELWNIAFNTVENLSGLVKEDTGPTRGLLKKCDRWPVILPVRCHVSGGCPHGKGQAGWWWMNTQPNALPHGQHAR